MKDVERHGQRTQPTDEIGKLMAEINVYKNAIQDAKEALASAEMELDDVFSMSNLRED